MGCAASGNEYTVTRKGGAFGKALENGTMAVIKGKYFLDCLAKGRPFTHRAQIEKEYPQAIFPGKTAAKLWYEWGHFFLAVISYCWLSKEHPDPQMFYLPYLKAAIEDMKVRYDMKDVGIIMDYTSFYQEPRTEEQKKSFKQCLSMINVPYGHKDVTAVKFVRVPETERRAYDDRGWTKFESDVIDSKPSAGTIGYGGFNVLTFDSLPVNYDDTTNYQRRPPVIPSRFKAEMEERRRRAVSKGVNLFTNGKDQEFLEVKYAETFEKMSRSTEELTFSRMEIGDAGVAQLCEALPSFTRLSQLYLNNNSITDVGAQTLAKALKGGAAPKLEVLFIGDNNVTEAGKAALRKVVKSRANSINFQI